ncbi:MAG TPA: ATP-dependent DNA helicase RecG [Candidatus Paceibacterota bacterium]|nr:ATP-dependent DNA helicase RecG [Candidatus Paceibacterota bacterium]
MRPDDPIASHFRLTPPHKSALTKLGITTVRDLLFHFPVRHTDAGRSGTAVELVHGERATVYGQIVKTGTKKSFRSKIPMGTATMRDVSSTIELVWFRQPYLAKMVAVGDLVRASGVVARKTSSVGLVNPEIEKIPMLPEEVGGSLFAGSGIEGALFPVYPESRGITSRWFYHAMQKVLASGVVETIPDPIPSDILKRYHLPELSTALVWIHAPREADHAAAARKRFAFETIFLVQIERQRAKRQYAANPTYTFRAEVSALERFIERLGFAPTEAQTRAIDRILEDFASGRPMLRLLEGDVGSGKTAVAAATANAVVRQSPTPRPREPRTKESTGGIGFLQVAYMAPTEILATQLFESFITYFVGTGIQIGLMTGSGCRKFPSKVTPSEATSISRAQLLKWVANGEIPILVGTHALIQKTVKFKHLAYVIIDEQHRFGTAQRAKLVQKDAALGIRAPHVLSMTATPIPRTLALTIYGDLDLTLLDAMPPGRKPVKTEIATTATRKKVEEHMRAELAAGRQAYVICPRIDEPDPEKEQALMAKSVVEEAKRLSSRIFPECSVEVLHGKMRPAEKDAVMGRFASGKTKILVATSVVEVGVNVPNATIIAIEGAERFGLAQLHQLRGRVLRGTHQAHCYLFTDTTAATSLKRLRALTHAANGFELAEMDLALRGAGELRGGKQWGISDLGMEAIKNIKMVEAAREEALRMLDQDPTLAAHPDLVQALAHPRANMHFE